MLGNKRLFGGLRDLAERYPLLGGYFFGLLFFFIFAYIFVFKPTDSLAPKLSYVFPFNGCSDWYCPIIWYAWFFHFTRRMMEVVYVHQYRNFDTPDTRDPVGAAIYYAVWGSLNGMASSWPALMQFGMPPYEIIAGGAILYMVGEFWNMQCHIILQKSRHWSKKEWVVIHTSPFSYIISPHYSFEVLSWFGFMCMTGFTVPSMIIFVLSVAVLIPRANRRKEKIVEIFLRDKQQLRPGQVDPRKRWVLIPFIY
jgi:very-long-chain enoyl-CoA reductase